MCNFTTWGTEVEIIAFAQLSGYDVITYTEHKQWAVYLSDWVNKKNSERAFYMTNESGCHFDPLFDMGLNGNTSY